MNFFEQLENRARAVNSLLCVGLDPHPADLSEPTADAALDFCLRLIEATADVAAAYKPNAAFFEAFGEAGWAALRKTIQAIPPGIPIVLDAKRGDIASTAAAYARSAFETLGVHAITLSPYLGRDSIEPFIEKPEHGVFLLCKTSNPGAQDLQDLPLGRSGMATLYEYVAHLAQTWNERGNIGLVVGATQLESLARVRAAALNLWFLAPGVGAQGGDLRAALHAGLRPDGFGMLIPVSRAISRADDPHKAAEDLRAEINEARASIIHPQPGGLSADLIGEKTILHPELADALLDIGCVKFGEFTLKSGLTSPIYIDLRRLTAHPRVLEMGARAYLPILQSLSFDHLAALPYAALPIASVISLLGNYPLIYPRKEAKAYGTGTTVEGVYQSGDRAVVIDDLITTGGSKFEGIEKLAAVGLAVSDVVVLIDRQSGGEDFMAQHGLSLHAVFTLPALLDHWEKTGRLDSAKAAEARQFLEG